MTLRRVVACFILVALTVVAVGCGARRRPNLLEGETVPGVTAFRMVSETDGWAVRGSSVLRTSDGGRSWKDVSPGKDASPYPAGAYFADSSRAWVAVTLEPPDRAIQTVKVYRTSDGGKTWDSTELSERSLGALVQFVDYRIGWMMVRQGVAMMHEAVVLFRTADGGATWVRASATSTWDETDNLPFAGGKTGMSFRTEDGGYVSGYVPVSGSPYLHETADGGKTWTRVELEVPLGFKEHEASVYPPIFWTTEEGILPVQWAGPQHSVVFYSTEDGGRTWTSGSAVALDPAHSARGWDSPEQGVIVVVAAGAVHISRDSGQTWTEVTPDIDLSVTGKFSFVSARVGWALAGGVLYVTADGGKTWTRP